MAEASKYLPQIPGVRDVHSFWRFFDDEKQVTAFFKTLDAKLTEINESLSTFGKIKDIDRLSVQARDNWKMAEEELASAKAKAAKIIDDAEASVKEKQKKLSHDDANLRERKADFDDRVAATDRWLRDEDASLIIRANELDAKTAKIEADNVRLDERKRRLVAKAKVAKELEAQLGAV